MARMSRIRFRPTRRSSLKSNCSASSNASDSFARQLIAHVNKLRLIIGAALRSQLRWAREHLYYWLVLGPVVVGFTTFTAARVVDNLSAWQPAPSDIIAAAIV